MLRIGTDTIISKFISEFLDIFSWAYYIVIMEVNKMANIVSAIRNTVSISLFNRGLAGKIFEEVKQCGAKVVMRNNTAECVLMSPDEYLRLIDEVNDARLLTIATTRIEKVDPSSFVPAEQLYAEMGITQADLDEIGEVDIE